jgi:hypothetical protein
VYVLCVDIGKGGVRRKSTRERENIDKQRERQRLGGWGREGEGEKRKSDRRGSE